MPVEHDSFEDRLGAALRQVGGTFDPDDQTRLAAAGRAHGRRLQLRRRVAVLGGAASIALVGLGGALLLPGGGSGGQNLPAVARTEAPTASPTRKPLTAVDAMETLKNLLPEGKFSNESVTGVGLLGSLVYDDGKGLSTVRLSLVQVEPGSSLARETTRCPDKTKNPYDSCEVTRLPDSSVLRIVQEPGDGAGEKIWTADLLTPDGRRVEVSETNTPDSWKAPATRDEPPLSTDQLQDLVTDPAWDRYVTGG
ncbi:hypothetical protein [Streptomyces fulvoviolaceus]|uniref:hypothetical protein n=1 Tax=Streptomyces fulvoviolaceus TaxID=285535 RepID=UPI0021BEF3B0|nr:hypothetical protein [Streptomyces fulvoviolaceus]MCT9084688.1 hypothetical protein [Streptomyces fulvoviolaceus]